MSTKGPSSSDEFRAFVREVTIGSSRRMSFVGRYSSSPVLRVESVAEHTYFVMYICAHIYENLRFICPSLVLDLGTLLLKALMHDADEMHTGDIPRPFKYHSPSTREAIERASQDVMESYIATAKMPERVAMAWSTAKGGSEGLIVKVADMIQVVSYLFEEISRGNKLMRQKLPGLSVYLEELKRKLISIGYEDVAMYSVNLQLTAHSLLPWVNEALQLVSESDSW